MRNHLRPELHLSALAALVTVMLSACGGGGSIPMPTVQPSSASLSAPVSYPGAAAGGAQTTTVSPTIAPVVQKGGTASDTVDTVAADTAAAAATAQISLPAASTASAGDAMAAPLASGPSSETSVRSSGSGGQILPTANLVEVWSSNFASGLTDWFSVVSSWGDYNRSYVHETGIAGQVMSVFIPKGSIDPASMRNQGLPYGGTGFQSTPVPSGADIARLRYKVRVPADFMPGLGGKLPGLCGGACNGGGHIPNGYDGFSARLMWNSQGTAEIYAYLPSSQVYGTHLGIGQIPLPKGQWTTLIQEVKLNTVGASNGYIKMWADGKQVINQQGLVFRFTSDLKINGIYFDNFYGGNTADWAAPQDTTIQFAEFSVSIG